MAIDLNIQPKTPVSTGTKNNLSNDKISVGTTNQTDISISQNLFGDTKQTDVSKIGTNNKINQTNVFENSTAPSKDAYNYSKDTGGEVYETQKQSVLDTAMKLLNNINKTASAIAMGPGTGLLVQKLIGDRGENVKHFGLNVAGGFETTSAQTARGLSTLAKKDELSENIQNIFEQDVANTKRGQNIEQEDILTNIQQRDLKGIIGNVGYQLGQMGPSIGGNILGSITGSTAIGKIAGGAILFPSMFQEAYDVYSADPNISDKEAYVASIIAGILMSAVEEVGGLEDLTAKGGLHGLAKNIKNPVLRFLATYGIEINAEGLEEVVQKVIMDMTQGIVSGKVGERVNSWNKLKTYMGDLLDYYKQASATSALIVGAPTYISVSADIREEERKEERDNLLEQIAEDTDTYEEFKENASIIDATEEDLQNIWDKKETEVEEEQKAVFSDTMDELEQRMENVENTVENNLTADEEYVSSMAEMAEVEEMDSLMEQVSALEQQQEQQTKQNQQIQNIQTQQTEQLNNIEKEQQQINQAIQQQELLDRVTDSTGMRGAGTAEMVIGPQTKKESGEKSTPVLVNGTYVIPQPKSKKSQKGKTLSRKELETEYRKTSEEYKASTNRVQTLTALANKLRASQNKNNIATEEDKKAVRNSSLPTTYKTDILNRMDRSLEEGIKRINTIKRAEKKHLNKVKQRLNNQAFNRIYKLTADAKDNIIVGYSDFVIKHRLKSKETEKRAQEMIEKTLYNMSKLLKTNVADIFQGCKIIFIDHQGKGRQAWGSMQGFIDGSGTPIIPINLNYVGWKESTIVHELVHGMDFIYQYRKGGTTFTERYNNTFQGDFQYTLETDLPSLLKELRKTMNNKEKATGYWKKGTEIMSRVFQEYYEYTFLKDKAITTDGQTYWNTLNEPYHWKDINLVERTVNNVIDLFRAEFGLKPLDRDINNLDDFIRKTSTIAETFNNMGAYDLFECMSNVGHQLNQKMIELDNETNIEKREQIKAELSEIENSWNLLQDWGTELVDTLFGGIKEGDENVGFKEQIDLLKDSIDEGAKEFQSENEGVLEGKSESLTTDIDYIDSIIKKGQENWKAKKKRDVYKQGKSFFRAGKDLTMKVSSRLYNIDPKIAGSMAIYEGRTMFKTAEYSKKAFMFVNKMQELKNSTDPDKRKIYFLLNRTLFNLGEIKGLEEIDITKEKAKVIELAEQAGVEEELENVFYILSKLAEETQSAGLRLNTKELYFPRQVVDYEGLKQFLDDTIIKGKGDPEYKNEAKSLVQQIQDLDLDKSLTEEEKARRIRNKLEELNTTIKKMSQSSNNQLTRKISSTLDWGDELLTYYATPEEALIDYIPHVVERIERARFFGRGISAEGTQGIYKKMENLELPVTDNSKEAVRLIIGGKREEGIQMLVDEGNEIGLTADDMSDKISELENYINQVYGEDARNSITAMVQNAGLTTEKGEELEYVLNSYFGRAGTPGWIQWIKDTSYILYLGNFTSAITQLGDISFSVMQGGIKNTIKAICKKAEVTVDDLGIENLFDDIKHGKETSSSILNKVLEITQFKKSDIEMKQLFIQTVLETMREQAQSETKSEYLKARLNLLYGEDTGKEIFEIYKSGEIKEGDSFNEMVMVDLLYNLSATQPIMKSSATVWYNNNPASRFAYTMKTFTLTALDLFIHGTKREYDIYKAMGKSTAEASARASLHTAYGVVLYVLADLGVQGLKMLVNSLFGLWDKDNDTLWKKSFVYQWMHYGFKRASNQLGKDVLDAVGTLAFINDYSRFAWQTTGGAGVIGQMVAPPITSFITNVVKIITGEKSVAELTYNIPGIGSIIYYGWGKEWGKTHKLWQKKSKSKKWE